MERYIGEIQLFAFSFCPRGWVWCEGQLLRGSDYAAMRYILGNTYGGDGETTLGVPDLRGKSPIAGADYYLCVEGLFPERGD